MQGSGAPPPPLDPRATQDPSRPRAEPPGGFGQPLQMGFIQHQPLLTPKQLEDGLRGAELVRLSTWLLFGGLVAILSGCGGSMVGIGFAGVGGFLVGVVLIVVAAVVGQIGRGLQGRVI